MNVVDLKSILKQTIQDLDKLNNQDQVMFTAYLVAGIENESPLQDVNIKIYDNSNISFPHEIKIILDNPIN